MTCSASQLTGFYIMATLAFNELINENQEHPSIVVLIKRCSENMQQIYKKIFMPKCGFNFIEITLQNGCSPVNLLYIVRTRFPKNTSGGLLPENVWTIPILAGKYMFRVASKNTSYWKICWLSVLRVNHRRT